MDQVDTLIQEKSALVQKCDELELENQILNEQVQHLRTDLHHLKEGKTE
mgnify:CR=1 FL=1